LRQNSKNFFRIS